MRAAVLACAALAIACRVHRERPPAPVEPELTEVVSTWLRDRPVPGVSVAVLRRGEVVLAEGFGVVELGGAPATTDTTYRLASITKPITAAAILQQVEAGRIDLDAPVVTYLPSYPEGTITTRQLLSHTSGIPDYPSMDAFDPTRALSHDELVGLFADLPLEFAPGSEHRYSSSGFYLLGLMLEQVTGQSYADVVRSQGVPSLRTCGDDPAPGEARGYTTRGDELIPAPRIAMANPYAAGALCASAIDVARWLDAMAHGRIVTPASWRAMTTPARLADGRDAPYGLGLRLEPLDGHPRVGHSGVIDGFTGRAWYLPEADLVVVVLTNTDVDGVAELADRLIRTALDA